MASETAAIVVRPSRPAPWRDPRLRGIALQVVFVAVIAAIIGFLAYNTTVNLRRQNIAEFLAFTICPSATGALPNAFLPRNANANRNGRRR